MSTYHQAFGNPSKRKAIRRKKRFVIFLLITLLSLAMAAFLFVRQWFLKPNVWTTNGIEAEIFIPTGSDFSDVKTILYEKGLVIRRNDFERVSKWLKYDRLVKPGRYILPHGLNNLDLVRLLRSGAQKPVNLTFNNIRDVFQLAGRVAQQIEADSASIARRLTDSSFLSYLGFNNQTIPALFIPNTYEFWWTTNAENFISRMTDEYKTFWTADRQRKADLLALSRIEVSTLASIIDRETNKDSEKATIAGVYLNRLRGGWRLQADPTLIFAAGDFEIRRVLDIHKNIDSPYNTYLYPGLPPGPICIPSIASIDAVLNPAQHHYYYFCAKDDLSGYHAFASSYTEHEANARRYRNALDRLNIKK